MTKIVAFKKGESVFYAVRWSFLGMFKYYLWLKPDKQAHWSYRGDSWFLSYCLTRDYNIAKESLDKLIEIRRGVAAEYVESDITDLEKVLNDK